MRVIVCLDEKGGMMFNRRRQSRDRTVIADVIASLDGRALFLAPYSETLWKEQGIPYTADEAFLTLAEEGDVCFVENRHLSPYVERIEEVTVYHWNRSYPTDFFFDLDLSALDFRLWKTTEWQGYSHKKITKEIFVK